MAKREFLQLAHVYDPKKHHVAGWMLSEKLDGVRAFWDGGVSRGLFAHQVPWANVEKDARYKQKPIATGLWTRYGNTIQAPDWWLDKLPNFQLDGELWMGNGKFQSTVSVVKDMTPGLGWKDVFFAIIDIPPISNVFADGEIKNTNYKKKLNGCAQWVNELKLRDIPPSVHMSFESTYKFLQKNIGATNPVCYLHEQIQLPFSTQDAQAEIDRRLADILLQGGEGIILRKHTSSWVPERTHNCLKMKPFHDAEAVVTGFTWGRETALGSKLLGKMGALIVKLADGQRLELSGFTDAEREVMLLANGDSEEGYRIPGKEASADWSCKHFLRGTTVSFKYRELSDGGIPKEARYLRKRPTPI